LCALCKPGAYLGRDEDDKSACLDCSEQDGLTLVQAAPIGLLVLVVFFVAIYFAHKHGKLKRLEEFILQYTSGEGLDVESMRTDSVEKGQDAAAAAAEEQASKVLGKQRIEAAKLRWERLSPKIKILFTFTQLAAGMFP
jgi:hypothetical protein